MFTHLLVPLDGSPFAEKALVYALGIADKCQSRITLLQVLPAPWKAEMKAELPDSDRLAQEIKTAAATAYLREKEKELQAQGYEIDALIMHGTAVANVIVEAAEAEHIDGIVMSTHGLTGLKRMMLGSVAEKVVGRASVPLLLIRAESD